MNETKWKFNFSFAQFILATKSRDVTFEKMEQECTNGKSVFDCQFLIELTSSNLLLFHNWRSKEWVEQVRLFQFLMFKFVFPFKLSPVSRDQLPIICRFDNLETRVLVLDPELLIELILVSQISHRLNFTGIIKHFFAKSLNSITAAL